MRTIAPIDTAEALELLEASGEESLVALMSRASKARRNHSGNSISLCCIVNAKCGLCGEDCAFCAQSRRSKAEIQTYPLVSRGTMMEAASAFTGKAGRIGIVTSGKSVSTSDLDEIAAVVSEIAASGGISPCASLGLLSRDALLRLKDAGLRRYHHNLETAESFWPSICGTRQYSEQIQTVLDAAAVGLEICSGGIFGLGESNAQRVELLATLSALPVDSIPINFLAPIPGTPLEAADFLTPSDCLRVIAVARLMMPSRNIRICGGRSPNLRSLQSWIFAAGADGLMIGDYLTTKGGAVDDDLRMLADAGMMAE